MDILRLCLDIACFVINVINVFKWVVELVKQQKK